MKVPRVGVGVVVIRDGMVLMGRRKSPLGMGTWAFPGGHLEFGETVGGCAVRELEEETGLKATICELGGWSSSLISPDKHYITLFCYVRAFEGEPQLLEPEKCEGWEWFEWNCLPKPLLSTIDPIVESGEFERFILQGQTLS